MKLNEVKQYTLGVLRGAFTNKNVLDDISAEGKNLRYKGNNLGDSYIFEGVESYSENETVVGRWTDGKPIYQKTFNLGSPAMIKWVEIDANPIYDKIISVEGYGANSTDESYKLRAIPYILTTSDYIGVCGGVINNKLNVYFRTGSGASLVRAIITIKYTKTTDAPGSSTDLTDAPSNFIDGNTYSENEVVIGQWIDGKPIYRKVFSGTEIHQKQSWQVVSWANIGDLNIERIIDSKALCRDVNVLYPSMVSHFPISISTGNSNLNLCPQYNDIYVKSIVIDYTKTTDEPQDMFITSTLTTTATDEEVAEVFA